MPSAALKREERQAVYLPRGKRMRAVRNGENPELTTREKHIRECFVVLEDGADAAYVEKQIKTMPNYFADYHTVVHFISEEEFGRNHQGLAHGGFVFPAVEIRGKRKNISILLNSV